MPRQLCIVGVGEGGGRIADLLCEVPSLSVVVVNTDVRSFEGLRTTQRVQIGSARTEGLGTGGDVSVGRMAAEDARDDLQAACGRADLVIGIACLGGGTGSGALPVILGLAKERGATTVGIGVLPFKFEGNRPREQADHAAAEIKPCCDLLMVVPNDRLSAYVGEGTLAKTFDRANEVIAGAVASICRLITEPGYLNLDYANLVAALRTTGGSGSLAYGEARGAKRAEAVVARLLDGPMTEDGRVVAEAKSVLVSIVGGPDLSLRDVESIMNAIRGRTPQETKITMGTAIREDWKDRVAVTLVAAEGLQAPSAVASDAPSAAATAPEPRRTGRRRDRGRSDLQTQMDFDEAEPGRFRGVDPTLKDGENLDVPTFIRRRLSIDG